MTDAQLVLELVAAGASGDVISIVMRYVASRDERDASRQSSRDAGVTDSSERAKSAARSKAYRDRNRRDASVTDRDASRDAVTPRASLSCSSLPSTELKEASNKEESEERKKEADVSAREGRDERDALRDASRDAKWPSGCFLTFWARYPNKVGKTAALRSFVRVQESKSAPAFDVLMAALDRYIAGKPVDRAWCNPATWLNQGRWEDEPAAPPVCNGAGHGRSERNGSLGDVARRFSAAAQRGLDLEPYQPDGGLVPPRRLR